MGNIETTRVQRHHPDGFILSDDKALLNFEYIHRFLKHAYWCKNLPEEILHSAIENSWCFGLYTDENEQKGFARLVTDMCTFAYLSDVFVDSECRGQGLGLWMTQQILLQKEMKPMRRVMLATKDAHGLYAKAGFGAISDPEMLMQIKGSGYS